MIEIVKLKNPFDRTRREAEHVDFVPGQLLTEYIADSDVEFILNGNFIEQPELTYPCDGDQIIVLPDIGNGGFKGILRTIASIALTYYVGTITGGTAGLGIKAGTLGAYLAAGAVMYIGGRIINAVFPTQQKGLDVGSQSSQTYGWDTPQPITGEGGIVGITYGECIPAPQVLERHVETLGDKQYLCYLLCGGMGPVDDITDIKIGSTPIGNYQNVQIETRLGTNDQEPISFFDDTPLDQSVGLELTETEIIKTTDSTVATGLEVTIEFPNGLYYLNDKGGLSNTTVQIQVQYRKTGTTDWQDWPIIDDDKYDPYEGIKGFERMLKVVLIMEGKLTLDKYQGHIIGSQNTAVRRAYRLDGLDAGQYDVKLKILSRQTGSRYCTTCTWSILTSHIPGIYARPNKVLLGLRILATNQLSGGIPDVTWRQKRSTVYVWNPETGQYETRAANNPIWAAYDVYHQCRYLKNINTGEMEYVVFGVPHTRLDPYFDEWTDCAAYADEQIAGLDGAMENRFEFDAFFDTEMKRYDAAQKAANVGHAVIIPRGNNIGIKCDKPGQMVQIFGEGRTTMSSLNGTFTGTDDRAKIVEVVYSETGNDFKNTQFLVRDPDWATDLSVQANPAQLQLFGVKRRSQAYREGVYTIANNKMVTQFIDIGTDIDAMVCEYGDIVGLNHTVPQIGVASGRIVEATANTIQLDKTVPLLAGLSYQVILQLSTDDSIVTKNVVAVSQDTETDTLTLTEPFTTLPQQFDNYVFGESGKVVKPFRLVSVEKDGDLRCKLNLAEYVEGVYSGDLNYPIVDYTPPENKLFDVDNLKLAEENYRSKDGVNISLLHGSWNIQRGRKADEFAIYLSEDGSAWRFWGTTMDMRIAITNVSPLQTYWVNVRVLKDGLQSGGTVGSLYITGKDDPPSDVPSLAAAIDTTDSTKVILTWPGVDDVDLRGYQVREGSTVLTQTPIRDTRYVYTATETRNHIFSVYAVDNSGNLSAAPATCTIFIDPRPATVAGFLVVPQETDRSRLVMTWTANTEKDIAGYIIKIGDDWDTGTIVTQHLKALTYVYASLAEGYFNFMIKAVNNAGKESAAPAEFALQITLRPDAPQNLNAEQKEQDRSIMLITWDASPGKDIAGYEIRYGDDWDTGSYIDFTTNTFYEWDIPQSGMYNIMVKAKTVAGYYSNVSNVSIQTFIEAYDVTGFTGAQSVIDRVTVHLMWDNPLSHDVAYFEIRRGGSWDSGVVVADRVTNNYVDVTIPDEGQQTWWIKAITVGGKYSLYPASFGAEWDLNPSPVTNISLTQDINDKSVINISFTGITEIDLLYYEIRYGWTWQDSTMLVQTTNTSYQFRPDATSGNVKVLIKAVNKAQYYSDEASKSLYATLEPQDVQNFIVQQNGEYVELYWDRAYENDVVGYEIREGWTFEYGQLIATNVTGNSYSYKVDFDGPYHYWIKAINRSNKYSVNAVDQKLNVVDLPPKNVIQSFDEMALHSGTHTNTEFGTSLINWQTIGGQWPDYPDLKFEDVGGSNVLKLKIQEDSTYPATGVYECEQIDVGRIVTANVSVKFLSTVKYQGETSAILQMRTSKDGADWSVWKDFLPAKFVFRYIELRVNMTTTDPLKTPEVNTFNVMVDLPDIEKAGTVEVPVGGIRITYDTDFYIVPVVTPYAIGSGVRVEITDRDKTGFYARILDLSGADVGGTMDWRARGY